MSVTRPETITAQLACGVHGDGMLKPDAGDQPARATSHESEHPPAPGPPPIVIQESV